MSFRRPSVINRSSTQTTELPTQEVQIRGYRAMTRGRYQAARVTRRVFGRNGYNTTLELAVEPERQLELLRERTLTYPFGDIHDKVTCTTSNKCWYKRFGTQLVYMFPDMVLSIDDFHNHVEVAIQTHGYDTWQGGKSNLLVTMAMISRLSNTSYMRFQYSVDNVVDHLTTTGITAIPEERSDWDDDKRSGGKLFVIQEKLAQNQQDFLDEYLPQWDDQLATRKPRSELEWENPFAVKREMCKDATLAKELRDLSLCSAIPIPGYYMNKRKKCGIRRSRTYKGKPRNSHVKPFKRKYKDDRGRGKKCKCFIYGKEGHFAKDCRSKQGNITRSAVYQELDLDDNWDIVSADFDDSTFMAIEEINESDDEQNIEEDYYSNHAFMFHPGLPTKIADMVQSAGSWKPDKELPTQNKSFNVKRNQQHKPKEEKDFSSNEVKLLKELLKEKTEQVQQMIRDQAKEYYEGKISMREKEELWQTKRSLEEFPPLGNSQVARPFMEGEAHYSRNTTTAPKIRKITNQLYNVKVEFEIPSCPMFGTTAIIDSRASSCCISKKVIPEEALEPLTHIVFFNGLNSRHQVTHRIKQGSFLIEGNKFKIPLIYAFDMKDNNGMEMMIGADFLRSMKGGIRIEGDEITIYKKVTRIKTSNQTEIAEIAELEEQYSLPGINTIIKRVGGAKVFSKFNLKLGFHQVAMDEESIPWTAFLVPGGLYEWLVMPFGLKNAPAIFQRKMDKGFKETESFILLYIDDILVFSKK
uniref:TPA: orf y n=1 Tax=Tanacetum cinerariifolium TaxID=118510 RepID=A0A6L2K3J2_TANCI|nr:TPA: orf y [Tanacetum cinerariifolium]